MEEDAEDWKIYGFSFYFILFCFVLFCFNSYFSKFHDKFTNRNHAPRKH